MQESPQCTKSAHVVFSVTILKYFEYEVIVWLGRLHLTLLIMIIAIISIEFECNFNFESTAVLTFVVCLVMNVDLNVGFAQNYAFAFLQVS